jgi:hypothetical protein
MTINRKWFEQLSTKKKTGKFGSKCYMKSTQEGSRKGSADNNLYIKVKPEICKGYAE